MNGFYGPKGASKRSLGLRRGGLVRLRAPDLDGVAADGMHARLVPKHLCTREKNNAERTVRLSPTVRVLVAQWYRTGRPRGSSAYVFPGVGGGGHMEVSTVNRVCAAVFRRAGVPAPLAHPHAFRHTAIKMLWMKGNSFEQIAKWIGHRNPSTTSTQYGHLTVAEINARMIGLDWLGPPEEHEEAAQWRLLGRFLYEPYAVAPEEWPPERR